MDQSFIDDLKALRQSWIESRQEAAEGLPKEPCKEKGAEFGWWDACCCIEHDLNELIKKHEGQVRELERPRIEQTKDMGDC